MFSAKFLRKKAKAEERKDMANHIIDTIETVDRLVIIKTCWVSRVPLYNLVDVL